MIVQSGLLTTSEEVLTAWRATTAPLVLRRVHRKTPRKVAVAQCSAISRYRFLPRFLKVLVFSLSVCQVLLTRSSLNRRIPSVSDPLRPPQSALFPAVTYPGRIPSKRLQLKRHGNVFARPASN